MKFFKYFPKIVPFQKYCPFRFHVPQSGGNLILASEFLQEAYTPNATTNDDRGGSVRIPLAGEGRKREGERESEIEREQRANTAAARGTDEKDPTRRRGGGGGGKSGRVGGRLDLITPRTSWLTMQPRESGPKSWPKRNRRLENTKVSTVIAELDRENEKDMSYEIKRSACKREMKINHVPGGEHVVELMNLFTRYKLIFPED